MSTPVPGQAAPPLSSASVEDLVRVQGFPPLGEDFASRVAVGASNAVAAVVAARRGSLIDTEPSTFLGELEGLHGPVPATELSKARRAWPKR